MAQAIDFLPPLSSWPPPLLPPLPLPPPPPSPLDARRASAGRLRRTSLASVSAELNADGRLRSPTDETHFSPAPPLAAGSLTLAPTATTAAAAPFAPSIKLDERRRANGRRRAHAAARAKHLDDDHVYKQATGCSRCCGTARARRRRDARQLFKRAKTSVVEAALRRINGQRRAPRARAAITLLRGRRPAASFACASAGQGDRRKLRHARTFRVQIQSAIRQEDASECAQTEIVRFSSSNFGLSHAPRRK